MQVELEVYVGPRVIALEELERPSRSRSIRYRPASAVERRVAATDVVDSSTGSATAR